MTEPPEVAAALARARDGDADAFGELVDRYRDAVLRAAVAATGSAAEAEDAAQDAFITAFRGLGRFRGESSFKTWLLTIAWNKALDRRRASRRWLPLETPGLAVEPAATNPAPDAELAARGARDAARLLIARLPFKLRDPLLLTARGEHSYEEISTMLGIPVGTLKWRVSEARRIVKEKLRRMGY